MAEFDPSQPFEAVEFDPNRPFEAVSESADGKSWNPETDNWPPPGTPAQGQVRPPDVAEEKPAFWQRLLDGLADASFETQAIMSGWDPRLSGAAAVEDHSKRGEAERAALVRLPTLGFRTYLGQLGAAALDKAMGSELPFGDLVQRARPQVQKYYSDLESQYPAESALYAGIGGLPMAAAAAPASLAAGHIATATGAGPVASTAIGALGAGVDSALLGGLVAYNEDDPNRPADARLSDATDVAVMSGLVGMAPGLASAGVGAARSLKAAQPLNKIYAMLSPNKAGQPGSRAADLAAQMDDIARQPTFGEKFDPSKPMPGFSVEDTGQMKYVDDAIDAAGKGDIPTNPRGGAGIEHDPDEMLMRKYDATRQMGSEEKLTWLKERGYDEAGNKFYTQAEIDAIMQEVNATAERNAQKEALRRYLDIMDAPAQQPEMELDIRPPAARHVPRNSSAPVSDLPEAQELRRPPMTNQSPIDVPGWQPPLAPGSTVDTAKVAAGKERLRKIAGDIGAVSGGASAYAAPGGNAFSAIGGAEVGKRLGAKAFDYADDVAAWLSRQLTDQAKLMQLEMQGGQIGNAARFIMDGVREGGESAMAARAFIVSSQPWFREQMKEED